MTGRKCRKSHEIFFEAFEEKVAGIKCQENSKIKMSREFKIPNWWEEGKSNWKISCFFSCQTILWLLQEKKNKFFKKLIVTEIKCRDKSESKLSLKEEVVKYARIPSWLLVPATFSSSDFFFLKSTTFTLSLFCSILLHDLLFPTTEGAVDLLLVFQFSWHKNHIGYNCQLLQAFWYLCWV